MALPKLNSVTYSITVPSTGKDIEIRPFNVKEQKILMIAKESGDQGQMIRAARDLIAGCTLGAINVNELTMFDFEYIFLMARAKSVGETTDIRVSCRSCKSQNDITINIEDAHVQGEIKKDMKVKLTDNVGVLLKYPRFTDAEKIAKLNGKSATAGIDSIMTCIDSIYDADNVYEASDQSAKELQEFVESLSTKQFKDISDMFKEMPTVSLDVGFKCIKCRETNEIKLEGLSNFF